MCQWLQRGPELLERESLEVPESLTDDLWGQGNRQIDCGLSEIMAPATGRNAFCDLLHLIRMSLDDVLFNCIFHASLHSGGKGSRNVQNIWMVYINPYQYKRIHRLYDSNINILLMSTFIIFFLLTNVNLITAIFIILHYFSVVWSLLWSYSDLY